MICLTFDVEEQFHSHLTPADAPRRWTILEPMERLLDELEARGNRATFFIVGEVAEKYPELVKRIHQSGFEIGSHTHSHIYLRHHSPEECLANIARSKDVLEQITGAPLKGFRSPTWSAKREYTWLWEALVEMGFSYDSSLFPFYARLYGSFSNPVAPYMLNDTLVELPPAVHQLAGLRMPYGGGFYFRLYPSGLTRWMLSKNADSYPLLYLHPWEFATANEKESVEGKGLTGTLISNLNRGATWDRLMALLDEFPTHTMADAYEDFVTQHPLPGVAAHG